MTDERKQWTDALDLAKKVVTYANDSTDKRLAAAVISLVEEVEGLRAERDEAWSIGRSYGQAVGETERNGLREQVAALREALTRIRDGVPTDLRLSDEAEVAALKHAAHAALSSDGEGQTNG